MSRPSRGLDLYWNYGPGRDHTTEELVQKYEELLEQFDSGAQAISVSGGVGGSQLTYISPDQAMYKLRRMLKKLQQLLGEDFGAGDDRIKAIVVKNHSAYTGVGPRTPFGGMFG